ATRVRRRTCCIGNSHARGFTIPKNGRGSIRNGDIPAITVLSFSNRRQFIQGLTMVEDRHSYGRGAYLRLMAARPELFENTADAGIEILTSREAMDRAENAARDDWACMGYSGDDFRC